MTAVIRHRRTRYARDVVELFAGPGGASLGIHALSLSSIGVELDDAACLTRLAAGLETIKADVSSLNPRDFDCQGLWASPPCQGFSRAGLQKGIGDAHLIIGHIQWCRRMGQWMPAESQHWADPRSHLVLEPLRWALEMTEPPRWICLEQVPFVLVIWEAIAEVLRGRGYHVWTGKLHAEQFGVPQTRERAILIASLDGPVGMPTPTHSKFYNRDTTRLDPGVQPWVSMADALGWGMTERPYLTVAAGTAAGGQDPAMVGGSGAQATLQKQRDEGRWVISTGANSATVAPAQRGPDWRVETKPYERPVDYPSPTVDTKVGGAWQVHEAGKRHKLREGGLPEAMAEAGPGDTVVLRSNTSEKAAVRAVDQPGPTMMFGERLNTMTWELRVNAREKATRRTPDQPAPTITAGHSSGEMRWHGRRKVVHG